MPATTILAQSDTETPGIEVVDPVRPVTDLLIEWLGIDPEGPSARLFEAVVEPVIQVAFVVVVAWLVHRVLRRVAGAAFRRAKRRDPGEGVDVEAGPAGRRWQRLDAFQTLLGSILGLVVWTWAVLTILAATFGISLAPFLAGAGIIGIALGFGAQHLVRDFVAGLFMLMEDQYGLGDVVDLGEAIGVVEGVSLRTTRIRDVTGTVWHIPNGEIRRVGNMSQEWSSSLLDIGVAYDADVDTAADLIKEVADAMAGEDAYRTRFLDEPEVWGVENVAAEGVVLRLVIKTLPGEQWAISRELRRRIKYAFDQAGIGVPVPQRAIRSHQTEPVDPSGSPDPSASSAAVGSGDPVEPPPPTPGAQRP